MKTLKIQALIAMMLILTGWLQAQTTVGPFTYYPTNQGGTMQGQAQIDGVPAVAGDIIAAFNSGDTCVGAKELTIYSGLAYINFVIYGDDGDGFGMDPGEDFYLKLYDVSEDVIIDYGTGLSGWANTFFAPMPGYDDPSVIYYFIPLPTCEDAFAYAGVDSDICENNSYYLDDALAENYQTILWTSNGDGTFSNATIETPVYFPGPDDIMSGSVSLCMIAYAMNPCQDDWDCMTLSFVPLPQVNAGVDATINETQTYELDGTATNYSSLGWTTNGDGTFNNPSTLIPVYTPGTNDISNGSAELCLEVQSVAPCVISETDCITLSIISGVTPPFEPIWTTPFQPMNVYVLKATIDEPNMVAGDQIGIFDIDPDNGEEICVGAGILVEELTGSNFLIVKVSMDDGTGETNGFQPGNEIIYRLWSPTKGEVELVTATYPYSGYDEVFTPLGSGYVELEGFTVETQIIDMITGWNLISFRVTPAILDMEHIFTPLINSGSLTKVIDQDGNSLEFIPIPPPFGQWNNSIGNLTMQQGYYSKVSQDCNLTITYPPVDIPFTIPLRAGWNIISMPCKTTQDAQTVLQDLIDNGILIKAINDAGNTIEHIPVPPPNGQWFFGFESFEPSEGYYIKVNQATTITFECDAPYSSDGVGMIANADYFVPDWNNNPYMPMSVVLSGKVDLVPGQEIGVFDGDICVGASVIQNPEYVVITVSMDDPLTDVVDGFIPGNEILVFIYDPVLNQKTEAMPEYISGAPQFEALGTFVGTISFILTDINNQFALSNKISIIPNPANDQTAVFYNLPETGEIEITLFEISGIEVMREIHLAEFGGNGKIILNTSGLNSGCYIMQFNFKGNSKQIAAHKKLIIK